MLVSQPLARPKSETFERLVKGPNEPLECGGLDWFSIGAETAIQFEVLNLWHRLGHRRQKGAVDQVEVLGACPVAVHINLQPVDIWERAGRREQLAERLENVRIRVVARAQACKVVDLQALERGTFPLGIHE